MSLFRKAITAFCVVCVFAFQFTPALSQEETAEDEIVYFYSIFGWGEETDSQYAHIYSETHEFVVNELGQKSAYRHFRDEEEFFKEAAEPNQIFVIVGNRYQMWRLIEELDYRPLYSYSILDLNRVNISCLYVRESDGIDEVEDLRGKSISLSHSAFSYSMLRETVGEKPEEFFASIRITSGGTAGPYLFYMKETDAGFISDQLIAYLKRTNPAVVKGFKSLGCTENYGFMPMLASPVVDEDFKKRFFAAVSDVFEGRKKNKFYELIKFFKMNVYETDLEDYRYIIDVMDAAYEKGWIKDFENMVTTNAGKD